MLVFRQKMNDDNKLYSIRTAEDDLVRFLRFDYAWQTSAALYKRSTIFAIGGFEEGLPFWQDVDLHIRLLIKGFKYKYLSDVRPDSYYRISNNMSISGGSGFVEKYEILEKRVQIYTKNINTIDKQRIISDKELRSVVFSAMNFFAFTYLNSHKNKKKYKHIVQQIIDILHLSWRERTLYRLRSEIRIVTLKYNVLKPFELFGKILEAFLDCGRKNLFKSSYKKFTYDLNQVDVDSHYKELYSYNRFANTD
jgi:hypothetical protein